ncbi:MAG TPA: lysozyme [Caulobacteraceae bacterium]|nr:lysozyme [Caulobacteraceae bacterium]
MPETGAEVGAPSAARKPPAPRHVSRAAVTLIKRFEGLRRRAARLDDGRWTLGYGHTKSAREGASVSDEDAEALLAYDLIGVVHAINEWVHAPLTQNQFDALASFVFNIGLENFRRSTTLRRLNEGRMLEAAAAMELWRRADFEGERIVIDALVRRRSVEKALFLKPDAWPVAPSPVLPPKIDYEAAMLIPSQTPTALKTDLEGERATAERDLTSEDAPPVFHEPAGPAATAAEIAAASVSERLAILFSEEETAGAEAARDIGGAQLVPEEQLGEPADETLAEAVADQPSLAAPGPAPIVHWERRRRRRRVVTPLALFGLGLLGVALFIAAIALGFRNPTTPLLGGMVNGAALGWGLGLAGAALFAFSVYRLLARGADRG